MAVSIFGHLDTEQRKLWETRTVHNDDRVNAPEIQESGHLSACQATELQNEAKIHRTEREEQHMQR